MWGTFLPTQSYLLWRHLHFSPTLAPTAIYELQGGVSKYTVVVTDGQTVVIKDYDADLSGAVINEFEPNTRYGTTVTITVHGGAAITSEQVYTTTQDGGEDNNYSMPIIPVGEYFIMLQQS